MLKSANKAATSAIISSFIVAVSATVLYANETPKFDKRIEAAAKEIVAKKIGDIRGSVENDAWVAEYGVDDMMTGPVAETAASAKPAVQVASLSAQKPSVPVRISERPVRKISSFIYF